mgnify:CR=1 FL=1
MINISKWDSHYDELCTLQEQVVGKVIKQVSISEDDWGDSSLEIRFEDGTGIAFFDDGQSCCESRYMSVDGDDLSEFVGAKYVEAFVKDGLETVSEYGDVHEVQFLEVRTSKGSITVSAHNEHNGYYGGFNITIKKI